MSKVGIETVTVDSSLVSVMTYSRNAKMLYVTFKNEIIVKLEDEGYEWEADANK